eukprot:gnl/TRDRNA2_/TRDRNA2_176644_c4_seq4.p1 gnl/TRDRNA2_/TRDRNA2_176644_c4~~gnl/TRDRNA2_/TRDRNA2_176644_c4_seq4.p1  ORF type:complete len:357 (+),score=70.07 gnl/TRDRNA2_/TRDRNA2_176644_c4_seq4:61-1131(+)
MSNPSLVLEEPLTLGQQTIARSARSSGKALAFLSLIIGLVFVAFLSPTSFNGAGDGVDAMILQKAGMPLHTGQDKMRFYGISPNLGYDRGNHARDMSLYARRFFVGGNWKANGSPESVKKLVEDLNKGEVCVDTSKDVEVVCAPPFPFLSEVKSSLRKDYHVAAQNAWDKAPGAWTGETPATMLTDMGIGWVILGHSERRENCAETSQVVADKTKFCLDSGLKTITCIGEKLEEREGGTTFDVLASQLKPIAAVLSESEWDKVVLAYEPVWAIGTGKVATPDQAEEVHAFLRKWLSDNVSPKVSDSVRILYGGSVNDKNSEDLGTKPNIDGFLVGGASLQGDSFTTIINSAKATLT